MYNYSMPESSAISKPAQPPAAETAQEQQIHHAENPSRFVKKHSNPGENLAQRVIEVTGGVDGRTSTAALHLLASTSVNAGNGSNEAHQQTPDTEAHAPLNNPPPGEDGKFESLGSIPVPASRLEVSRAKALAWIGEETDPELQRVRQSIVDNIDTVSFERFKAGVEDVTARLNKHLAQLPDPSAYGVLWGYKPHASNTWVAELARPDLLHPPQHEGYFAAIYERPNGYPTLEALAAKGVYTVVSFDDAIYSGAQAVSNLIEPIYRYNQAHPDQPPMRLILAVPFVTQRFLDRKDVQQVRDMGLLEIISTETMPTLTDSLSPRDKRALDNNNGALVKGGQNFYQAPTTVFDHRVPDSHSFPEEATGVFFTIPSSPYAERGTEYYARDEASYRAYQEPLLRAMKTVK